MKGFFFSIVLLLLVSVQTNPERPLGTYELVLENHSKQTITIQKKYLRRSGTPLAWWTMGTQMPVYRELVGSWRYFGTKTDKSCLGR